MCVSRQPNRSSRRRLVIAGFAAVAFVVAGAAWSMRGRGFSARDQPTLMETWMARGARRLAMPRSWRDRPNPVPASPEVLADARAHFADHCAICHANDGSGDTPIGRNLYPKAPDMRLSPTQSLTDGELFYIIHNGIRLTGMPAWGDGDPEEDEQSWELVHFIRHLPAITEAELGEMRELNPKGAHERQEEEDTLRFLLGDDEPTATGGSNESGHHQGGH